MQLHFCIFSVFFASVFAPPHLDGALLWFGSTFYLTGTVGCVWNFQIGGGYKSAIFQYSKLKFDIVLYFGMINSLTVAKIFSCKNLEIGVLTKLIVTARIRGNVLWKKKLEEKKI